MHTADNGVQHTVVRADQNGWHVKIGSVQSKAFKSILELMRFLNGYVKLLPPWGPMEEADGEYGRISLVPGLGGPAAAAPKSQSAPRDQYGETSQIGGYARFICIQLYSIVFNCIQFYSIFYQFDSI